MEIIWMHHNDNIEDHYFYEFIMENNMHMFLGLRMLENFILEIQAKRV